MFTHTYAQYMYICIFTSTQYSVEFISEAIENPFWNVSTVKERWTKIILKAV